MSCHRTIIRLSAVLAVVALTKGCGDGENPAAPPTPEPARPTTVTVSPATDELTALGQTVQLTAEAFDKNGHAVAGAVALAALGDTVRLMVEVRDQRGRVMESEPVMWASNDTLVAAVDSTGLVTAAANGTATITASAGGVSDSTAVRVGGWATLSTSAATIAPSDTLRLTAGVHHRSERRCGGNGRRVRAGARRCRGHDHG